MDQSEILNFWPIPVEVGIVQTTPSVLLMLIIMVVFYGPFFLFQKLRQWTINRRYIREWKKKGLW